MADRKKRFFKAKSEETREAPKVSVNMGPAGIPKPEYIKGKDHINEFLIFKDRWNAYVAVTFDSAL